MGGDQKGLNNKTSEYDSSSAEQSLATRRKAWTLLFAIRLEAELSVFDA